MIELNKSTMKIFVLLFSIMITVVLILTFYAANNVKLSQYIDTAKTGSVQSYIIDISSMKERDFETFSWHGLSIGIYKRSQEDIIKLNRELLNITDSNSLYKRKPAWWNNSLSVYVIDYSADWMHNNYRSIKKEYFVFIRKNPSRVCNIINTIEMRRRGRVRVKAIPSVFIDPCSNDRFDLAGRIYFNEFASKNLLIPSHEFIDDNTIKLFPNK